ncbi:MAG: PEP-CTERM sorting domain-containing protein [Polymorphobacter sp.]
MIASAAQANLVSNGSFETTAAFPVVDNYIAVTNGAVVPGWASSYFGGEAVVRPKWFSAGCVLCPTAFQAFNFSGPLPASSPDGGNFIFSDANFLNSALTQTITGLTVNGVYKLTFYQALSQPIFFNTGLGTPGPISAQWSVSLFGTQLAPALTANGATGAISPWTQQTMTFTATSTTGVLSFLAFGSGDPPTILLDGVNLSAVPEPKTWAMMMIGLFAMGIVYRRQRWRQLAA